MYNPRGLSLSTLFWGWISEWAGRFLCAVGAHHERQIEPVASFEQNWKTGVCERCGRRI